MKAGILHKVRGQDTRASLARSPMCLFLITEKRKSGKEENSELWRHRHVG
jgi:hypothetical protein